MAKSDIVLETMSKAQLLNALKMAKTCRDKNKAVKYLKKFTRTPQHELDTENDKGLFKVKQYQVPEAYHCYRCDAVKQAKSKVFWSSSKGTKHICTSCYLNLINQKQLQDNRGFNSAIMAQLARTGRTD